MIVVPVYNMILTPNATVFFQVDQLRRSSGGSGVAVNERVILAPLKENGKNKELTEDSFYGAECPGLCCDQDPSTGQSGKRLD